MSKFDKIYESVCWQLREQEQIPNVDLRTRITEFAAALQDKGFLSKDRTPEQLADIAMRQEVKSILIGGDKKNYLPAIRIEFFSPSSTDNLEVSAEVLSPNPSIQKDQVKKTWNDIDPETIRAEVLRFVEQVRIKFQTGDASVQNAPPETGAAVQPGAQGGTALPTNATSPAPAQEQAPQQ
jgi:hypothetical protein